MANNEKERFQIAHSRHCEVIDKYCQAVNKITPELQRAIQEKNIDGIPIVVVITTIFGDDNSHIFRSTDKGLSWTDIGVISAGTKKQVLGNISRLGYAKKGAFLNRQSGKGASFT